MLFTPITQFEKLPRKNENVEWQQRGAHAKATKNTRTVFLFKYNCQYTTTSSTLDTYHTTTLDNFIQIKIQFRV